MASQVIFTYNEQARRWMVAVDGEKTEQDARQAFATVVLTCQHIVPELQAKMAGVELIEERGEYGNVYSIVPVVRMTDDIIMKILRAANQSPEEPPDIGPHNIDQSQN